MDTLSNEPNILELDEIARRVEAERGILWDINPTVECGDNFGQSVIMFPGIRPTLTLDLRGKPLGSL